MSITTVIRNGRGGRNQSTPSKVQTLLRSGGLDTNRHIVSHTPIYLPKVNFDASTMSIYATTDDPSHVVSNGAPLAAVKRRIDIVVDPNGAITFDGEGVATGDICLGHQWDRYVTILHFDLSNLRWKESDRSNYLFRLAFYDEQMVNKVESQVIDDVTNYFYFGVDPITYEFDGEDFFIPDELTEKATRYRIILIIQEKVEDEEEGNTNAGKERFISNEFCGYVESNFYTPEIPLNAISYVNRDVALSKEPITVYLADDGTFALNTTMIANTYDAFIRTFDCKNITSHLTEFEVFALFHKDKAIYAAKVDKDGGKLLNFFIPKGVARQAGTWEMMMVAYKGNMEDPDYFYTSTIFNVTIEANFLDCDSFDTDSGIVGSLSTENNYTNFVTADGQAVETAGGNTFFYDEE